jgi:Zn-dependent protease with chaperone function
MHAFARLVVVLAILAWGGLARAQGGPPKDAAELAPLERAAADAPTDATPQIALCEAIEALELYDKLPTCALRLRKIAPANPFGWYWSALASYEAGDTNKGDATAEEARRLGLVPSLSKNLDDARVRGVSADAIVARNALRVVVYWLLGFCALALSGWMLSAKTLAITRRPPAQATAHPTGTDALLRKTYAIVLWIACAYFYVSIPLVLVGTVGGALVVTFGLVRSGHVGVFVWALPIAAFVGVTAVLRGLLARPKDPKFRDRLTPEEAPGLRAVLDEVAETIGTAPVDTVFVTPGSDLAVFERGGLLRGLRGRSERCMLLGAGLLRGMKLGPFRAILAHEYGHFHNEDTAGGVFALAVRRALLVAGQHMVQAKADRAYNLAFVFVFVFNRIFLSISLGATRLQESLADRWAARSYGAEAFRKGLRHVVRRSIAFDAHVSATLAEAERDGLALENLYAFEPESPPPKAAIKAAFEKAWTAQPSPHDSHPSPHLRVAAVEALALDPPSARDDDEEVWELFADREELERRMTDRARDMLWEQGLRLADPTIARRKGASARVR